MKSKRQFKMLPSPDDGSGTFTGDFLPRVDERGFAELRYQRTTKHSSVCTVRVEQTVEELRTIVKTRDA